MRILRRIPLVLVAMTIATAGLLGQSAGAVTTTSAVLHTTLSGAQEAHGDPNGSGTGIFVLNSRAGIVCYVVHVAGIAKPTAAHIHEAPVGVAGPVVIPLKLIPGATNVMAGCVTASKTLIQNIIDNPSHYYLNVHNADFPGGAVRGQLG